MDGIFHRCLLILNVTVEFWDSTIKFATTTVNLTGNGSAVTSATWVVAAPDTHVITVTVSPFVVPSKLSYVNNTVTKTIVLGQYITGIDDHGSQSRFSLGPVLPNPSRGTVELRFHTPFRAPARLTIYDVQGRRIKHWQWEGLPAGAHSLTWDGTNLNGHRTQLGVYFYRLNVGFETLRSKVVVIR